MRFKKIIIASLLSLFFVGCRNFLERPPLTVTNDESAWTNEDNVRLYANKYYTDFFTGYGVGWSTGGAPLLGYTFSDDVLYMGNQSNFTRAVPNSQIWSMSRIRSINIMIDRLKNRMKNILTKEEYAHWMGIARFFRAWSYANLVLTYGDVPYYDHVVKDTDPDDLYKARTPRDEVMDSVYNDLVFAMENVRANDGDQNVNKYVVAGFVSRLALYEGTWQKYYYHNNNQAKKFLELALDAGDKVMQSGKYAIVNEYRSLFTSEDLGGNRGCVLYRHYDVSVGITHPIATNCNLLESLAFGPSTALIKSYICNDGKVWQNSDVDDPDNFDITNLIKTRDPRFEASFHREPSVKNRGALMYIVKFLPRDIEKITEAGGTPPNDFLSNNNVTDYPVLRYAEVLLNRVEAKAELATLGGAQVSQDDLDKTINKIRDRPLATEAIDRGVKKTEPLKLAALPDDPNRASGVSPLLWEIRRERRMEFTFEHSRYEDLKRWHQLDNMDTDAQPDLLSGGWVDFQNEISSTWYGDKAGGISVVKLDGSTIVYDGNNISDMKGFYRNTSNAGRQPFLNQNNVNPYLAPVGKVQMDDYENKGYVLQQTEGWPQQ